MVSLVALQSEQGQLPPCAYPVLTRNVLRANKAERLGKLQCRLWCKRSVNRSQVPVELQGDVGRGLRLPTEDPLGGVENGTANRIEVLLTLVEVQEGQVLQERAFSVFEDFVKE